jgi:hypothetical protein
VRRKEHCALPKLNPICFRRGWLGRPLYRPILPAETIVPRISWDTSPHDPCQAAWDQIIEDHTHLLCWKEVNGIYRYGAWGKDPGNRPGSGAYWSSRASEFGLLLGLNLTEIMVGNGTGYAARVEDIVIPDHLRWCVEAYGTEQIWRLVPAHCPSG